MRFHKRIKSALYQAFASAPRYTTPIPDPVNQPVGISPWYFTAGPIFSPGAGGAILHTTKSHPMNTINGYAYLTASPSQHRVTPGEPLYAPKGVPFAGIGIIAGSMDVLTPAVNSDGTYPSEEEIAELSLQ
jgi:hypothetical protein